MGKQIDSVKLWLRNTYTRAEWLFLFVLIGYFLACQLVLIAAGHEFIPNISTYNRFIFDLTPPIIFCYVSLRAAYVMLVIRPNPLFMYLLNDLKRTFWNRNFLARSVPTLILVAAFFSVYTNVKVSIPLLNSYTWDARLAEWDKAVHFGNHPWELLQPILGQPFISYVINVAYNSWFLVLVLFMLWQIFDVRKLALRAQYLLTFVISWVVLGNVMAIMMASGGPCFYEIFVNDNGINPYAGLMSYLHNTNESHELWALTAQRHLLEQYTNLNSGIGAGISAMPSMHVAMATLMMLIAQRTHWLLGLVMTIYLLVILLGSVHLGWHYAIDGYVSLFATVLIWWLVGKSFRAVQPMQALDESGAPPRQPI